MSDEIETGTDTYSESETGRTDTYRLDMIEGKLDRLLKAVDISLGALDSRINRKLDRTLELTDRLMDPTSPLCLSHQIDKLDAIRADLDRLTPLADLFDQLRSSDDGQPPNMLRILRLAMGQGGG